MKAISIMWTEGVEEIEAVSAVLGIQQIVGTMLQASRERGLFLPGPRIYPFGTWVVPSTPQGDPYWGAQWYIDQSYDSDLGQVISSRFLELVLAEPWQQLDPHYDLAIIDQDLAGGETPWETSVLGIAIPGKATVVSVHHLRGIDDLKLRLLAIQRLVAHHFGHVLSLPAAPRQKDVEVSFGERHCAQPCVMRHAPTVEVLLEYSLEEAREGTFFCEACRADLLALLINTHFCYN